MRALTRISPGNRKVWQGFVSGYGFSHIETSATMTALAAAVAPDRRGIEFQIVTARMNARPDTNLRPETQRSPRSHVNIGPGRWTPRPRQTRQSSPRAHR